MNNILSSFSITNRHLAIIPVTWITLDLYLKSNVSKTALAMSYGYLIMLCSKIYCNDGKN